MRETKKRESRRLDRIDWIELALETLAKESIDAVSVVPLARKLGVTKGSFYWHFENREALLNATLEIWRERTTHRIIHYVEARHTEPEARLRALFKIAIESKHHPETGRMEVAIRDWARQDSKTRKVVARVDDERHAYLEQLYRELAFDPEEARTRAFMQMTLSSGNGIIFGISQKSARAELISRSFEMLLSGATRSDRS